MAVDPVSSKGEYAAAGVDYTQIQGFKDAMVQVSKTTREFPNRRGIYIPNVPHAHGGIYSYDGSRGTCFFVNTTEGLGNKNWIAEWMYACSGTGKSFYYGIGIDTAMMAVNDVIAQGAMPIVYTDEVAAGDSEWFSDLLRARELADGFYQACKESGMALIAGESPALRYLINAEPPIRSAPSLSGTVTGLVAPATRLITGEKMAVGDSILAARSSGLHSNGVSLVIRRAMGLLEQFMTKISSNRTLGEEALIPTMSYVNLVEAWLEAGVEIHALLPGTGDGVGKLAFDKREFTYRVHSWWEEIPPLMLFMRDLGVSLKDCLTTFNWGSGYYAYVPQHEVDRALQIGTDAGYDLMEVGRVEDGQRKTIFEPENITLPPPGE